MRSFALATTILMLAPVTTALSVPPLGEYPANWDCDAQTRVCAGIAVGGAASCTLKANFTVACTYTYGLVARARGPDGERGTEEHAADVLVTMCSSVRGCQTLEERELVGECSWLPLLSCEDQQTDLDGAHTTPVLAMGECVTLRVVANGRIRALVEGLLAPLTIDEATATFEHADEGASQVCRVDDGR